MKPPCEQLDCQFALVAPADPDVGIFQACVEDCGRPDYEECPLETLKEIDRAERAFREMGKNI